MVRHALTRALIVGWLLLPLTATAYVLAWSRLHIVEHQLAAPVLLLGLLLLLLVGQVAVLPHLARRARRPGRGRPDLRPRFSRAGRPGHPPGVHFSLSPIRPDSGR